MQKIDKYHAWAELMQQYPRLSHQLIVNEPVEKVRLKIQHMIYLHFQSVD